MSWTSPMTWSLGEIVTSDVMNEHPPAQPDPCPYCGGAPGSSRSCDGCGAPNKAFSLAAAPLLGLGAIIRRRMRLMR